MILPYSPGEHTAQIMDIWLRASRTAHSFIPMAYWEASAPAVEREILPGARTRVFVRDGRALGFLSLIGGDYIGALFVDPDCQGRGIGRALLDDCKEGKDLLTLSVYLENHGAVGFYQSQGFVPLDRRADPATGHEELLMAWRAPAKATENTNEP